MESDSLLGFAIIGMFSAICIVPFARIFQRAGRTGWWALLMLIPLVNLVVLWVFAFAEWPTLDHGSKFRDR